MQSKSMVINPEYQAKQMSQAFEKLHRDIIGKKEFYLKVRKEYDRITIYENVLSVQKDQKKEYKDLR